VTSAEVSVIIPCYNGTAYLGEALASACAQRATPREIIVVDDGSTDDSAAIAAAFGGPVRCVRTAHRGIGAARNAGMAAAGGALLAFLDADDLWPHDSLAIRLAVLDDDSTVECVTGRVTEFISSEITDLASAPRPRERMRGRVAGTLLLRRSAAERIGLFNESLRVGETIEWIARADAAGIAMRELEHVVLRRRIHRHNTTAHTPTLPADYLHALRHAVAARRDATRAAPGGGRPPA
jgi:glycosyltransferase involved in cell wall biosynthesis